MPKITLTSLKFFDQDLSNYVNFTRSGIVLSLNTVADAKALRFFERLDKLLVRHHGTPNLSKDSRLSAATVRDTYKDGYTHFVEEIKKYDPNTRFSSALLKKIM